LIKAYNEKNWAETPDKKLPVSISINVLRTLHSKWTKILKALKTDELGKEFIHPDTQKHISISRLIDTYAWHGDHHLAHINYLRKRMGW
jgi:hypothetical protein